MNLTIPLTRSGDNKQLRLCFKREPVIYTLQRNAKRKIYIKSRMMFVVGRGRVNDSK